MKLDFTQKENLKNRAFTGKSSLLIKSTPKGNIHFVLLLIMIFSFCISTNVNAQDMIHQEWILQIEKDEVKVYTRKNQDTGIKEIRITTTLSASVPSLMHILNDVSGYNDWVYKCRSAKRIKSISKNEFQYYLQTDFPFPVADRDLIVVSKQWKNESDGCYYSHSVANADLLPVEEGIVRINTFESFWKIIPNKDGSIDIDYRAFTNPGGNIPAWIINLGITQGPLRTFQKCIDIVEQYDIQMKQEDLGMSD